MPGFESMAGTSTVRVGTWESHTAPVGSFQQAEEARRKYGGMAVGPVHSTGVVGVMPGGTCSSLEGTGSNTQRDEEAFRHTLKWKSNADKNSPPIGTGPEGTSASVYEPGSLDWTLVSCGDAMPSSAGTELAALTE